MNRTLLLRVPRQDPAAYTEARYHLFQGLKLRRHCVPITLFEIRMTNR
jgi:hypothetical protein